MLVYPPVLSVHSMDARKYIGEKYDRLVRLTDHYRTEYVNACAEHTKKLEELANDLQQESDFLRPFVKLATDSTIERVTYELRLKLLRYTRRFQGNLCRFGFAGSQTHIAVCDSIFYQFNMVIEARQIATSHGHHIHDLHLDYH